MKIDVIIPIYNAYEFLVECVNSVYRYSNIEDFNLYLIDDCSPDKRIVEYLNKLEGRFPNLIIMYNQVNLGFVGTVNKGMKNSKNDVILLNSDTEVTENWLYKLHKAAYSDEKIATVTSLTNSGTICSVPNFCEDNELPQSYKFLDEYAKDIEQHSIELYPEAPTGVGFCMFIKRIVLNEVGFFDEENFGKGYGEENDFCCRCIEFGYRNIIDDATFIYHKGSASFSGKKAEYSANNSKVLDGLYPYYFPSVAKFIEENPLAPIQEMVKLQIQLKEKTHRVLYLLHNDFIEGRNHPYGGTELHVQDLINGMSENTNAFVLTPHNNALYLDIFSDGYKRTIKFEMEAQISITETHNVEYSKIVTSIVNYFEIELIHVHHLKGHSLDIFKIAKDLSIPLFYTIHDYYCLCPRINLLYDGDIYCRYIRSDETCNKCIKQQTGYRFLAQAWRKHYMQCLQECDMIFYPDASVYDNILAYCKDFKIDLKINAHRCIPHGMHIAKKDKKEYQPNKTLRVCVFGGVSKHKGSHYLEILIKECTNYEWHILGNLYDFDVADCENVKLYGAYERNDILNILEEVNPDVVLNLSICPETYSYVLSEAFISNIPVITTNLGAFENRVTNGVNGWKVSFPVDVDEVKRLLHELASDSAKLLEVRRHSKNIMDVDMMLEQYCDTYNLFYKQIHFHHTVEQNRLISDALRNLKQRCKLVDKNSFDQQEYDRLLKHVQEINASKTWKLCSWVIHCLKRIKAIFRH